MSKPLHYLRDYARGLYPFLACLVGGFFFTALAFETSLAVRLICIAFGCCCYAWAIDMAEARSKAQGSFDTADRLITALTNGMDTQITVTITEKRQAD
ncbi:hypothetical protein [Shinella pollutisoli]|uniref:Uncharacterized protein n=1 Tax=Shinella pollutisoli TaxID=2250594 RepID=A0ABV7DDC6_9HYPH|nr:hypothetical protein [Shinella pollutisoli]